jgi:Tfp pilus assembly protein PilP
MKLIKILALAIAMATMATAQNSGANGQTKATPSPTPAAAGKTGGAAQAGTKNAGQKPAAKTGTGTPAKAANTKAAATKTSPAVQGGATPGTPAKPEIKTATMPVKAQTTATPSAKGSPTPVVAAKGGAKPAETKKTEAKKPDTKKGAAAKTPSVIAVKPTDATKKAASKAASTQAKPPAKPAAPKVTQAAPAPKPAEKPKTTARSFGPRGRRDPFVSPIVKEGVNTPKPNCTSGKRCLVIPELVLQGTVKDTSGKMMAVVANSVKKTYFLRENDQVFQGSVEKITSDSIIFREYVRDALGRETAREVVKKLVPTS